MMPDLGHNGGFILASYVTTALIMSGIVWQSIVRYRSARRRLAQQLGRDDG